MTVALVEISDKSFRKSSFRLSTKNAWAKYARNRWPTNALAEMQREWRISEGQARGVLYAQASQTTIDDILDSLPPMKAFALNLEIACLRLNTSLEDYIRNQAEEARLERIKWEAEERNREALAADFALSRGVAGRLGQQGRADGSEDARLGRGGASETRRLSQRSFRGER